ncbi:TPA: hypothetical protein HA228_00930 [Candidatus Woesearchaeota archaeon]|nr:hypothetical protein [Candidatus Woesearchaeota archaeon]HIH04766.1 hypothetical protein [Candidatus Woesearchaeota archaeon]
MRLPFKPQTTAYSCTYATQAIALNYFLGTNYSDRDVVASLERGFPVNDGTFLLVQGRVMRQLQMGGKPGLLDLVGGAFIGFRDKKAIPSLEEAITISLAYASSDAEAGKLKAFAADDEVKVFYDTFTAHVDREILQKFRAIDVIDGTVKDPYEPIRILSKGDLSVKKGDISSIDFYHHREGVVLFGALRKDIDDRQDSIAGHSWAVDRVEDNAIVLLDTYHFHYGSEREISIPQKKFSKSIAYNVRIIEKK